VADFPDALQFLFEPARYKVLWGGRGGAKSWGAGRALLLQGLQQPIRVLCAREFQNSISDSVHKLLSDQIQAMCLGGFYTVKNAAIEGANGTEFSFAGLRHNVNKIKSFEGVDRVWVEEAQTVSKNSWEVLIPTIRKDSSEIWVTFNPELATDETYKRFVLNPPPNAIVRKINYTDNPWFPAVLEQERKTLQANDPDAYLNVWEGNPRETLDGAIYANEIRKATQEGRITRVPYDATKPVHTFWDLGWADNTSIWFAQAVGFEYRVIDFLQDSQKTVAHYVSELQARGYVYGVDYLPHDAQAKSLAGAGRSIEQLMRAAGRTVRIVPRMSVADGINAARTIFGNCWFDEAKCSDGLQALRHYRYEVDEITGQFSRNPLHDAASHAADAFRYLAVSLKEPTKPKPRIVRPMELAHGSTSWMS
jgi:phage terminase large subunit